MTHTDYATSTKYDQFALILLAAGQSVRFGDKKLIVPWSKNRGMAATIACQLKNLIPVIAVVSEGDKKLSCQLQNVGAKIVCNPNNQGIGSSIACGIHQTPTCKAWIIALADMPLIETNTYQQLCQQLALGKKLVAPVYDGRRGHPVGFSEQFRSQLLALQGDTGARHVIQSHQQQLVQIPVDDPGVITDIDYRHEFVKLKKRVTDPG